MSACVGPLKGLSQTVSACMTGERRGSVRACMRERQLKEGIGEGQEFVCAFVVGVYVSVFVCMCML